MQRYGEIPPELGVQGTGMNGLETWITSTNSLSSGITVTTGSLGYYLQVFLQNFFGETEAQSRENGKTVFLLPPRYIKAMQQIRNEGRRSQETDRAV
jgi:hypothetical protein